MPPAFSRLPALVCGVLALLAAGMYFFMSGQHQELRSSFSRTQECLDYAQQVRQLRQRVQPASTSVEAIESLGSAVEPLLNELQLTAAYRGLNQTSVDRADNPDYEQQSYQLRFDSVALRPLVEFCHTLTSNRPGLEIAELTLTSAQAAGARSFRRKETWNVVIVLTQLVFSPKTPS